jgi:hypothetical protein
MDLDGDVEFAKSEFHHRPWATAADGHEKAGDGGCNRALRFVVVIVCNAQSRASGNPVLWLWVPSLLNTRFALLRADERS